MNMRWIAVACLCGVQGVFANDVAPPGSRDYSYIYFENGYPTRVAGSRRAESMANQVARANPNAWIGLQIIDTRDRRDQR